MPKPSVTFHIASGPGADSESAESAKLVHGLLCISSDTVLFRHGYTATSTMYNGIGLTTPRGRSVVSTHVRYYVLTET